MNTTEQAAGGTGERVVADMVAAIEMGLPVRNDVSYGVAFPAGDWRRLLAALAAPPSEPSQRFMLEHTLDLLAAADHSPEAAMWITRYRAVLAGEPRSTELCSCGDCRPHRHEPPAISHHPPSAPPSEPLAGTREDDLVGGEGPAVPRSRYEAALKSSGCIEIYDPAIDDFRVYDVTTPAGIGAVVAELTSRMFRATGETA